MEVEAVITVTETALKQLAEWATDEQPDVYVRLMMVLEGG
ncbi:hypothetical protein EDD64_101205 [Effusibacillus lacus]|nr:hypothetical protein EDD64_101205 [Effusibacillus lacus]